ncbi:HAD family hydrolase [Chitinivibrio alkaliphilus]|uniref:Haloacid dehalogenase-like hydrolase n=1 Tax=Chitinivibrio alkaliphilus ACht1 TaxID=1313304 RepID=U7D3Q1_9BACT|nr:HAD family hydrolase [Chitinivibrio alkaliphilus]ERP31134.1 Haloacid dehalogenase-like hydrolase [Chitinivibrio alkaliphilus ACht1]
MTSVQAVIFDFDGTLYAMKGVYKLIFAAFCFPRVAYLPRYMRIRQQFIGDDFGSREAMEAAFCEAFLKQYGVEDASYWIKNSFSTSFIRTLRFMRNRPEYETILPALRKKGIRTVLFSDFGLIESRLRALGLQPELFDHILSAEDLGALKPAPRAFQTIRKRLQLPAKNILVVGDRLDTDGAAAQQEGMPFLQVRGKDNRNWDALARRLAAL